MGNRIRTIAILFIMGLFLLLAIGGCRYSKESGVVSCLSGDLFATELDRSLQSSFAIIDQVCNPTVVTFTLSAAGDVTLGNAQVQGYAGTFREMYDTKDPSYFFQNVKSIFEADDMTLVNFEGTLTTSDNRVIKTFNLKGDPSYAGILNEGSIETVSLGNNHHMDYGQQGHDDTVAALTGVGVEYAFDTKLGYYEKNGIRVGYVSVSWIDDRETVKTYLKDGIQQLQEEGMDLIICCCHWGIERNHTIESYQQELGRSCIDWGADLVLGCHPHVLQGIECYNGKYIVYSLGNFCFGGNTNPSDKNTMIFQQTFTFANGTLKTDDNITVIPCTLSSVDSRNDYQPTPASGERAQTILTLLNQYSSDFGLSFDSEGHVIR